MKTILQQMAENPLGKYKLIKTYELTDKLGLVRTIKVMTLRSGK